MTYNIGDRITFRDAGSTKTHVVTITQRWIDNIAGYLIPAFEGLDRGGMLRWGHDSQILVVRSVANRLE